MQLLCCRGGDSRTAAGDVHEQEWPLVNVGEPAKRYDSSSCCSCRKCLQVCCCTFSVLLVLALILLARIWTAECAITSFDHQLILPKNAEAAKVPEPFDRGIDGDNMDLKSTLGIDLAGVWWMDGNSLTAEHLVSFASAKGVVTKDESPFPQVVPVYNNFKGRWTWTDGIFGRIVMFYYAFDASVDSPLKFKFDSSKSATIEPVGGVFDATGDFHFDYINDNEWDRPDASYILRRVVNADGTEGAFWQKFLTWYDGIAEHGRMLVWGSDSNCMRRCQYFMPCFACSSMC